MVCSSVLAPKGAKPLPWRALPARITQILCLIWMIGCSGAQRAGLPPQGPQTAQAVLLRALARRLPQTLQGMTRLEVYSAGEARKVDLLVVVQQPDHLQFQALAPTLDLLALLSTDGLRFLMFERGGAACYVGPACAENLGRLVPIALPPAELALALLGRPPLLAEPPQQLAWDSDRQLYRLDLGPSAGTHQQVYVEPESFRFVGAVFYRQDQRIGALQYGPAGPGGVPSTVQWKAEQTDLTLSLRDVSVDQQVQPEVFAVQCPAGMTVVPLPCSASAQGAP